MAIKILFLSVNCYNNYYSAEVWMLEKLTPEYNVTAPQFSRYFLCTGGAYCVPYSCLLISNKFCNGGERHEQGKQVPLCICSSTPSAWALKPSSSFLRPKCGTRLLTGCHCTGAKKLSSSRAQPPPTCPPL